MPKNVKAAPEQPQYANRLYVVIAFAVAVVYYVSNPKPQGYYDYTFPVSYTHLTLPTKRIV